MSADLEYYRLFPPLPCHVAPPHHVHTYVARRYEKGEIFEYKSILRERNGEREKELIS